MTEEKILDAPDAIEAVYEYGANGSNPEEMPVFAWSRISHKWARKFQRVTSAAVSEVLIAQSKTNKNATPAQKHEFLIAQAAALESVQASTDEHEKLLASILVSLPQSWLVDGAAEGLTGMDLLDEVRQDKLGEIMTSYYQQQQATAQESKN